MKKLTALLLAAMILAMAACAGEPEQTTPSTVPTVAEPSTAPSTEPVTQPTTEPTTEPSTEPPTLPPAHEKFDPEACASLIGTWQTTVTMDKELLSMSYFYKKVTFKLYYTFDEHGFYAVHVDEEEFNTAIETYENLMIDHMVERRFATFKGQKEWAGVSAEKIAELWAAGEEQAAREDSEKFMATLSLKWRFSQLLRGGRYYVESGVVYTELAGGDFGTNKFTVKNSKLTLRNTNNGEIYRTLCMNFPMVLTKAE